MSRGKEVLETVRRLSRDSEVSPSMLVGRSPPLKISEGMDQGSEAVDARQPIAFSSPLITSPQEYQSTYRSSPLRHQTSPNTLHHHRHTTCVCFGSILRRTMRTCRGIGGGFRMPGRLVRMLRERRGKIVCSSNFQDADREADLVF